MGSFDAISENAFWEFMIDNDHHLLWLHCLYIAGGWFLDFFKQQSYLAGCPKNKLPETPN